MSVISAAAEIIGKALGTLDNKFMQDLDLEKKVLEEEHMKMKAYDQIKAIDYEKESELAKARQTAHDLQMKLQSLQTAVRSIVLRLKVLDVAALEKDLGEDGTIPLRLALSELKELIRSYDGMPKENMITDYRWVTAQKNAGLLQGYGTAGSTWTTTAVPYSQICTGTSSSSSSTGGTL